MTETKIMQGPKIVRINILLESLDRLMMVEDMKARELVRNELLKELNIESK